MLQRMKSPDGGFTHAYDEGEVQRLIGLGWTKEVPQIVKLDNVVLEEVPVEPARRGRPPKR